MARTFPLCVVVAFYVWWWWWWCDAPIEQRRFIIVLLLLPMCRCVGWVNDFIFSIVHTHTLATVRRTSSVELNLNETIRTGMQAYKHTNNVYQLYRERMTHWLGECARNNDLDREKERERIKTWFKHTHSVIEREAVREGFSLNYNIICNTEEQVYKKRMLFSERIMSSETHIKRSR